MKLKNHYTVTNLGSEYAAVPLDHLDDFRGLIKLNESGAEIFRLLNEGKEEEEIVKQMMEKHQLDEETARKAVTLVIEKLSEAGLLE